ncbi:hypothetical protein BST96_11730 [Oceanicoccus sagamiensis]|uniref:Outer membrane protein assembly factor BamC n=2 Tax=Oceanicoccus sagamiensis TaxID=716816 RepID=A0A1X9NJ41_9GAMM|nr:hypothetical protein BST96_11730 [Oceanicoccus sagamiensis]
MLQLSACSWLFGDDGTFRDRSNDYRQAKVEPPLNLPEGIDSESIDDSYAIPPISDRTTLDDKFVVPTPEPLAEDINRDSVRINTLGDQRWILVDGAPGEIWPRLRGFLSLNQLAVQRADAVSGLIETAWLQPSGEDALRERYRLRIDQGVQRGTSEVYVLQADIRSGREDWPEQSNNAEREEIMTQELAQYLADSSAAAAVSMLAQQAISSSGKITLEEDANENVYINLTLPFSRAWASVGKALQKSGYNIDDLNRTEQVYYVNYVEEAEEDDEDGMFAWMYNWASSDDEDVVQGIPYLVRLKDSSEGTVAITIERPDNGELSKSDTERLLKLIKRNIS